MEAEWNERAAVRHFVARCETRISSMHRIAGVFLNGAGLLVILPVFLQDPFRDVVGALLAGIARDGSNGENVAFYVLAVPAFLSLYTVVVGLYWLVKDIVTFYFVRHTPGFEGRDTYPRFSLIPFGFPVDEQPQAKREIVKQSYEPDIVAMIVPPEKEGQQRLQSVDQDEVDAFTPPERKPSGAYGDIVANSPVSEEAKNKFNMQLGQAGMVDEPLYKQAAALEIAIVRYGIYLRRLVLRYAKALLLLIWTMLVTVLIAALLRHDSGNGQSEELDDFWVLTWGYVFWSVMSVWLVRQPLNWIYRSHPDKSARHKDMKQEPQRIPFEYLVYGACGVSLASIMVAVMFFFGR